MVQVYAVAIYFRQHLARVPPACVKGQSSKRGVFGIYCIAQRSLCIAMRLQFARAHVSVGKFRVVFHPPIHR